MGRRRPPCARQDGEGSRRGAAVRFGAERFGAVRFRAVRFSAVRFSAVRFGAVRFGAGRFGAVRFYFEQTRRGNSTLLVTAPIALGTALRRNRIFSPEKKHQLLLLAVILGGCQQAPGQGFAVGEGKQLAEVPLPKTLGFSGRGPQRDARLLCPAVKG